MLALLEEKKAVKLDANMLIQCLTLLKQLEAAEDQNYEADEYMDAFIALGGNSDPNSVIDKHYLIEIIKEVFEMTIDMVVSTTYCYE